jgi:imidazolonepropionase
MTATVVRNIGQLITNSDSSLGIIENAALIFENGKVQWIGPNNSAPAADSSIDAEGGVVTPGFVDSHTHLVFAGDRTQDYVARMTGSKYSSGGINTTVSATRAASEDELRETTRRLVARARSTGTTTLEVKSGYGLNTETELKILKVAREFTHETTFLGAHIVPSEKINSRDSYIEEVKTTMLHAVKPYAKWIDVFCDTGAFSVDEAREILKAGTAEGLKPRLHGNQLGNTGGAELAAELKVASVDHCTHISDSALSALADAGVVATLLPGAEFFTRSEYPNAKRFFDAGVDVALATDCNPGSSFMTSMPVVISLAVREMQMTPTQAFYAATKGGALALQRTDIGHLNVGAEANLVIWQTKSFESIPYRMGEVECQTISGGVNSLKIS